MHGGATRPVKNIYLLPVIFLIPAVIIGGFVLASMWGSAWQEYALTHGHAGEAGTVKITQYLENYGSIDPECKGEFTPDKGGTNPRVEIKVPSDKCIVGTQMEARVCPAETFPYSSDCKGTAWTREASSWYWVLPAFLTIPWSFGVLLVVVLLRRQRRA
ncbi:hypothetical protein E1293_40965 [Actinomadura darangshiensis]|uniref:Uncharacterized protein n=1 Tax=Actinomadura darangshiensis TaxID=705336 RepID=A0A4R5A2S9_9ACTN|nr:hypothetical protein [Actinomadura darangshiensis]TDD64869.1 hypothetical protein E1293_40965 [Actinomadura darangshiensis]